MEKKQELLIENMFLIKRKPIITDELRSEIDQYLEQCSIPDAFEIPAAAFSEINATVLYEPDEAEQLPLPSASPAKEKQGGKKQTGYRKPQAAYCEKQAEPGFFVGHAAPGIEEMLRSPEDTFQKQLLSLIDKKNVKDSAIYKKADIDRRLFSKIRSNSNYQPKKQTALALVLALELNLDDATDLLKRAGYALSPSSRSDLIVQYCIEHQIYDLPTVNEILFSYDQPLLGGKLD